MKNDMKVKDLGNENDTVVSPLYLLCLISKPADVKLKVYRSATCSEEPE